MGPECFTCFFMDMPTLNVTSRKQRSGEVGGWGGQMEFGGRRGLNWGIAE